MPTDLELVEHVLQRSKELKKVKDPWLEVWQLIGEYVHTRKQNFTGDQSEGEFLNRELFDSTSPRAMKIAASSFLSMLWPDTPDRIQIDKPRDLPETEEIKKYYEFVTNRMLDVMDDPETGLRTSLDEYMQDQFSFATSGIEPSADEDTIVRYSSWGVSRMSISEGKNGFVDTVYIDLNWKVNRFVNEYGLDTVSAKIRELHNSKKFDTDVKFTIAVEPRPKNEREGKGNRAMPWRSLHVENDTKQLIKHSGFEEMPIKVARFSKLSTEEYGRGSGFDALPDSLELNVVWEAVTIAIEKSLAPPLGVMNDGVLGGGELDTSANGVTVFNSTGRAGDRNPVFQLFTVGEIATAEALINKLEESINNHFSIDRLLDFNNTAQMTLGEANIRNRLRNATLMSSLVRQIAELFTPLIKATFNILFAAGELGVIRGSVEELTSTDPNPVIIPDEVAELMLRGKDVYKIRYFTPAQRILQSEEVDGLLQLLAVLERTAAIDPTSLDNMDLDEFLRAFRVLVGAASQIERAKVAVEKIRKARAELQEANEEKETITQGAEALRNVGQSGLLPSTSGTAA